MAARIYVASKIVSDRKLSMAAGSKIKRMDLAELEKNNRLNIRALRSIVAWHWLDGVLLADYTHPSL